MTSGSSVHAVQISFLTDPQGRSGAELLEANFTLVDVAEAAHRSGIRVSVICASARSERLTRNGLHYYFLPIDAAQRSASNKAALRALLRELGPDVLHVHGLSFPRHVLSLASLMPAVPVILQDHASHPPRFWHRARWRRGMSLAAGIAFCALDQAQPFAAAGLIDPAACLYEIPESTSRFSPGDKQQARRVTGIEGDPAILWVGHLNANKDPLTVLRGISAASRDLPGLRLFCCFGSAPLLGDVLDLIATDRRLSGKVRLLGRASRDHLEQLMRAADLFVLGSHREGSGYSLIEALACGLPPVVTDIPSFRSLTDGGTVGKLWPCDDAAALCSAILAARTDPETRAAVRAHFDRELSFHAVGRKIAAMYEDVLQRRRSAAVMLPRGVHPAAQAG